MKTILEDPDLHSELFHPFDRSRINIGVWPAVAVLAVVFLSGVLTHALARPISDGVFYTRCAGYNCVVRAHVDWWAIDPVLYFGPPFAINLEEDPKKPPAVQMSAKSLAAQMSHLLGYGAHWRQ